ncbi:lysylphosphatidylglycerol synthase domain-containing protein [Microlunatus flavus]|uniref:Uncharacterized membrane protein YbhN, UPF0104 family n=1 Tax=Microlunatus flavus TaxID=1036181 RepID=A0A1H8ZDI5_9ACTN|nr:lysylphosphatidylglycerol synthase domain-containing protein [Microlunatus flavus]SEP62466.1 Uncharacterized membrane protein YbhN, UPF0104 family [Microlunatus flavus]
MSVHEGRRSPLRLLASVGVAGVAVALVAWVPGQSGSSWSGVAQVVREVSAPDLAALAVLWLAGLVASATGLAACLPGLLVRRALALSLAGSAVANVLPLGGAAGIGTNYAMVRSWGHGRAAFATYTVVTNLFDVVSKVVVVAVAAVLVLLAGQAVLPGALATTALGVAGAVLLGALLLLRTSVATAVGGAVDTAAARLGRVVRRPLRTDLRHRLPQLGASCVTLLRRAWPRVVAAGTAYALLQAVLLAACQRVCGLHPGLALVAALFATDRLLTLVPVTPGGVGVVETALSAVVLAGGLPAAPGLAAVLLYRALTVAAEVPVGGAVLLGWGLRRSWGRGVRDLAPEPAAEGAA